ncbi:MAG TPA: SGNH/GDSL hydrolase family protein, partial [Cellulomonas sp.]
MTTPLPDTLASAPRWSRFVAIGDSFTEGLWDVPDADGECRGWADQLAGHLSERRT